MHIVISLSSGVTKSAIMEVYNRRAANNVITKRIAANMEQYIDSHKTVVEGAIKKHGTAAKVAEALFLSKYGKPMPKAENITARDKNASGADKKWLAYVKKNKLNSEVKERGLSRIKDETKSAEMHKRPVDGLDPEQIFEYVQRVMHDAASRKRVVAKRK